MGLFVNRIRYKGGSPRLGASSGIINNAVLNGHDFYDDDYNPTPPAHDYSQDYFTVEAIDGGNITIKFAKTGKPNSFSVYYSTDGVNWGSILQTTNVTLTGKVYLKANVNSNHWGMGTSKFWRFDIPQYYKVSGNIMSLIYGDNFLNQTTLKANYEFAGLFYSAMTIVDAENLVLPAAEKSYCYYYMFNGCGSLTKAPKVLPATTLASNCYEYMFYNCGSLTTAPVLPATTLANYCYHQMFYGCGLTTAPELPATTLASWCYERMFQNCRLLVNGPNTLPATTLPNYCFRYMFTNCSSLISTPILPATTLSSECYYHMFYGCTSLNKVTCLATDISATNCLMNWLNSVSATGTFIKNQSMTGWPSGVDGIPNNWTVQDYVG